MKLPIAAKRGLVFSAAAIAVAGLAACSSGGSSSSSSASPTATLPSISADSALAAKVPADIKSTGVLKFGTDASYAPAEFYDADGKTIIGYDVDLGTAIAAKLGLKAEWTNGVFDKLIPGVTSGQYNASMSSFTINKLRLAQANMVSYFTAGTSWAVKKGNPTSFSSSDLCGKKIAVQTGTTQADSLKKASATCTTGGKAAIDIQSFQLQTDAASAVASGKTVAMTADSPVVGYAVSKSNGQLELNGDVTDQAKQGIVVAKKNTALATVIQEALQELMNSGDYQKILDVWGVGSGAISQSVVNPTDVPDE